MALNTAWILKCLYATITLALASTAQGQFVPRDETSPSVVYTDAQEDRRQHRNAEALEKLQWLFRNGHKVEPAFDSVRLSFCVGEWCDLADDYKPAQIALEALRHEKEQAISSSSESTILAHFREIVAIDTNCDAPNKSAKLFRKVSSRDGDLAKAAFPAVRNLLFELGDFETLSQFIEVGTEFRKQTDLFKKMQSRPQVSPKIREVFLRQYRDAVLHLVEMAVFLKHNDDARQIVDESSIVVQDAEFIEQLEKIIRRDDS